MAKKDIAGGRSLVALLSTAGPYRGACSLSQRFCSLTPLHMMADMLRFQQDFGEAMRKSS